MNDALLSLGIVTVSVVLLQLLGRLVSRGKLSAPVSRKALHSFVGSVWIVSWYLYGVTPHARWIAAAVPAVLLLYSCVVGLGWVRDDLFVLSLSRSGKRRELLTAPVYYCLSFLILILVFWRHSPVGVSALLLMCIGDALAEVFGQRLRSPSLPWNRAKTIAGSLGMLVGGGVAAGLFLGALVRSGALAGPWHALVAPLVLVIVAGTLVESLSRRHLDNLSVPLVSALVGFLAF